MILDIAIYIISFAGLWVGAKMTVHSVDKLARHFKLKSFLVSFVVLGLLTSLPEIFLAINSSIKGEPEISAGNLLGGIPVLFLLVIPILAIGNKGIKLNHQISFPKLFLSLAVIALPAFFIIDNKISKLEGILFLIAYFVAVFVVERNKKADEEVQVSKHKHKRHFFNKNILLILFGVILVFISSHFIVEKTIYFSNLLELSSFIVSLFVLALGTNLPELSIAISSIVQKKSGIAFGDYLGSAAANTLIFGLLSFINEKEIIISDNTLPTAIFIILSVAVFFIFGHSKKSVSRVEGFVLLAVFIAFGAYSVVNIN